MLDWLEVDFFQGLFLSYRWCCVVDEIAAIASVVERRCRRFRDPVDCPCCLVAYDAITAVEDIWRLFSINNRSPVTWLCCRTTVQSVETRPGHTAADPSPMHTPVKLKSPHSKTWGNLAGPACLCVPYLDFSSSLVMFTELQVSAR